LDAPVRLADGDGAVVSGRLGGADVLTGGDFVELLLRVGDQVGCGVIRELEIASPAKLPVAVQVRVRGADENGERDVSVWCRDPQDAWVLHATATLAEDGPETERELEGDAVEVVLPEGEDSGSGDHRLHPALLEGAWRTAGYEDEEDADAVWFAHSWRDVQVLATGATDLHVRSARTARDTLVLEGTDADGAPVVRVGSVAVRPFDGTTFGAATDRGPQDLLYRVEWVSVPAEPGRASEQDDRTSRTAVLECASSGEALHEVLDGLRTWLTEQPADERLVVVTRGAVATRPDEDVDLDAAPVWGLLRSAQAEHPGRFVIVDLDDGRDVESVLPEVLASGESQVAVRDGGLLAPRLARATVSGERSALDPEGTVLVTGATGGLGRVIARHLAAERGVRRLLLVSRRGPDAPGAADLREDLIALGADPEFAACDVADREALSALLGGIDPAHPLTAVVHVAGVNDDAVLTGMTRARMDRVLRAKADAAVALHETAGDLDAFVLFSSASGILGGPGQANYAAANAYLDALAHQRRRGGQPAVSLAWGLWEEKEGMGGRLTERDVERMARSGMGRLSNAEGTALFDAALGAGEPLLVPADLDLPAVRASGEVPTLLRGLVRTPVQRRAARSGRSSQAGERFANLPGERREHMLLDLVRGHLAAVLGHDTTQQIQADRGLLDLGLDSLMAVELRNRLGAETGLSLPTTLVFNHPTPGALAAFLSAELGSGGAALADLDRMESGLADLVAGDEGARREVTARLESMLAALREGDSGREEDVDLDSATLEEVFSFIDEELSES
ncbi:type I polyketide synthase, partial [Nocardiopsis listeri]|uniref:type I polyketide synthase n=1 Tax=Nocardiopsis listeri TaxID=53440 RepID=UPI000AF39EE2